MDTTKATAALITAALNEAGMTRTALAEATGIASTTLFRILNGHTPANVEQLAAIARHLRVPAASLVPFKETAA